MSQPKVFEFAKEIGMETLALMDKIREWKLPVRSHMAELAPEMQDEIRAKLQADKEAPTSTAKKKVARKAPAKKEAAEKAPAVAKTAAKKTATKAAAGIATKTATKTAAKSPAKADAAAPTTTAKKAVVKKAAAKTVVRKKVDEEEAAAAEAPVEVEASEAPVEATVSVPSIHQPPTGAGLDAAPQVIDEVEPAAAPAGVDPAAVAASGPEPKSNVPARKREVVMTSGGPSSGIRSEAPRRNIVGRMDLSRVQAPGGATPVRDPNASRPGMPRTSGPGASRPGGPSSGGGLRTGFVAPASPMPFGEDANNFDKKRGFDNKKKDKFSENAAGGLTAREKELEGQLASFSATEFRKREMVFQPKKKKGMLAREAKRTEITKAKASKRVVKVNNTIKVSDLAQEMGLKAAQLTKTLMTQGVMATMNTELDFDTVSLIVTEFGFEAQNVFRTDDQLVESNVFGNLDAVKITRPPVVTVMGHVDHGKTSLLDAIRKANVAAGEAGGITQHIGAYQVTTEHGHLVTFLDTPGHEAFTAMRARGANATDIVIVVVAADDGVMPQTAEAVNHAKAAGVPIIIAVNKIDKPGATPDKIKQQMTEFEIVPEEWGGNTIFCNVSAHTKQGIPEMLEQIYLLAEMEELTANPERSATGVVIESRMDKGKGAVATLLVQDGTLRVGQSVVVGTIAGKVRSLTNDKGERVKEAGPSVPVEIQGLPDVPSAGDRFDVAEDEQTANELAKTRKDRALAAKGGGEKLTLEQIFSKMQQGDLKELPIVLKTDVAGSVEAIKGMFEKIGTSEVKIKLVHSAVGGINESDVLLASTAKGLIVGFNVRPDSGAQAMAKRENIEIKTYSIVYEMMDELKKAMSGLLSPDIVEKQLGRAEVRNTFSVPKIGTIAGCAVVDGKITRQSQVRLVRDGKIIYTGKLSSLKRFKDDAKEVASGYECGIGIENYNDLKVGDVIEAFNTESISREM